MKKALLTMLLLLCLAVLWRQVTRYQEAARNAAPAPAILAEAEPAVEPSPVPAQPMVQQSAAVPAPPVKAMSPGQVGTVEVEMFQQRPNPIRVSREAHEESVRQEEEERRSIAARDFLDGINQQVREREEELRRRTESLRVGLPAAGVREVLGIPRTVTARYQTNHYAGLRNIPLSEQLAVGQETYYTYSPRDGMPFDGRNGQGYDVLCLRFDPQGKLLKWQWERPYILIGGSLQEQRKQLEYWQGTPQK